MVVLVGLHRNESYTATVSEAWSIVDMVIQWLPPTWSIWAYSDVGKLKLIFCCKTVSCRPSTCGNSPLRVREAAVKWLSFNHTVGSFNIMMSSAFMMLHTVEAGIDAGGSILLHVLLPWQWVEHVICLLLHGHRAVVHAVVHLQDVLVNLLAGLARVASSRSEMAISSTTVTAPV